MVHKTCGRNISLWGRAEVCVEGCWGTVCGNGFIASDGSVVCCQIGFPSFGKNSNCSDSFLLKEQGLHQYSMHIMGKVQDQYGSTVLAALEISPHCLTVLLTLTTATTVTMITIITIFFLCLLQVWCMCPSLRCWSSFVQVPYYIFMQIKLPCA